MANKMQIIYLFIYLFIYLYPISFTRFGQCFPKSSGALDCIYSFWYSPPMLLPAGSNIGGPDTFRLSLMTAQWNLFRRWGARRCTPRAPVTFLDENCRWFEFLPNTHMPGWQLFGKTSLPDETRSPWYRVIHGLTPTQARRHDTKPQKAKVSVQCNKSKHHCRDSHRHFHLRTMTMYTSQDSCRTTYGPQIYPLKWTALPDVTAWPKQSVTRRYGDRILGSLCCAEWQFSRPTWPHGLPAELARKLKRHRKWTTSLAIIWNNTHDNTYSLLGKAFFYSLEERSLGRPTSSGCVLTSAAYRHRGGAQHQVTCLLLPTQVQMAGMLWSNSEFGPHAVC